MFDQSNNFYVHLFGELLLSASFSSQVCLFAGVLTISYGVAFVVSVCVEFPMIQLETMLRDGKKWAPMSLPENINKIYFLQIFLFVTL